MIKYLLNELGRAGRENMWLSKDYIGPKAKTFPFRSPTKSISIWGLWGQDFARHFCGLKSRRKFTLCNMENFCAHLLFPLQNFVPTWWNAVTCFGSPKKTRNTKRLIVATFLLFYPGLSTYIAWWASAWCPGGLTKANPFCKKRTEQ